MQVYPSLGDLPKEVELFLVKTKNRNVFNSSQWINIVQHNLFLLRIYVFTKNNAILFVFFVGITQNKRKKFAFINDRKFGGLIYASHDAAATILAFDKLCSDLKEEHNVDSLSITINSFDGPYHFIGSIVDQLDSQKFNCDLILDMSNGIDFIISGMSKKRRSNMKASLKKDYCVKSVDSSSALDIKNLYDKFIANKSGKEINKGYLDSLLSSDLTTTLSITNNLGVMLGFVIFVIDEINKEAFYFMSVINRQEKSEYVIERIVYQFIIDNSDSINKLNFMESAPTYDSGVYKFKSQWGAESFPNITVEKYFGTFWLKKILISLFVRFIKRR
jgi:hypothetical protein